MRHIWNIPALTIIPRNTKIDFEYGWKDKSDDCRKSVGEEYLNCMEEKAYNKNEIFVDFNNQDVKTLQTFFFSIYYGLDHFLQLPTGTFTQSYLTSKEIHLNSNISYTLIVMDPNIWILSEIHDTIPRYKLKISEKVNIQLYLKVALKFYV